MKKLFVVFTLFFFTSCEEQNCGNNLQDGDEDQIDCGGSCMPCPTCTDGIKNQTEVAIDCGGECQTCAIQYPETGVFGSNILYGNDTIWTTSSSFSFTSIVLPGSSLLLKMELVSGSQWEFGPSSVTGYTITNFTPLEGQTFHVLNPGTCDLNLTLPQFGTYILRYYENSTFETRNKVIIRY